MDSDFLPPHRGRASINMASLRQAMSGTAPESPDRRRSEITPGWNAIVGS